MPARAPGGQGEAVSPTDQGPLRSLLERYRGEGWAAAEYLSGFEWCPLVPTICI